MKHVKALTGKAYSIINTVVAKVFIDLLMGRLDLRDSLAHQLFCIYDSVSLPSVEQFLQHLDDDTLPNIFARP